jgi:hypothetical protein
LKPLPNEVLAIIIKINLTTNYQLLLNCNKVHRAWRLLCNRGMIYREPAPKGTTKLKRKYDGEELYQEGIGKTTVKKLESRI